MIYVHEDTALAYTKEEAKRFVGARLDPNSYVENLWLYFTDEEIWNAIPESMRERVIEKIIEGTIQSDFYAVTDEEATYLLKDGDITWAHDWPN